MSKWSAFKSILAACIICSTVIACGGGGSPDGSEASPQPILPATFTVGGTISGLSGTVVLQNNASNALTVSVNGAFTFAGALPNGAGYAVTVLTQPTSSSLQQICSVSNGVGSITASNVAAVNVVCTTSLINGIQVPPPPGSANDATVAGVDSNGNGIRDDIDILIATKYGGNLSAVRAAELSARASQTILGTNAALRGSARAAIQESGDAGVCAGRAFRAAGLSSESELNELFARTYNTRERIEKHKIVSASAGQFERSVVGVTCQ
jgi:hypothetical protein